MSGPDRLHRAIKTRWAADTDEGLGVPESHTKLAGTVNINFKQTFDARGNFETLMLMFEVEHQTQAWGFFAMPRAKFSDVQHIIDGSTLWLHQAYAFYAHPYAQIKAGKVISVFGRSWDYGFYGPLLANNDVKMAPDIGLTAEGTQNLQHRIELYYAAQYSPIDGRALALGQGHQALRLHTRREHITAARLAPSYKPNRDVKLTVGVSGQRFEAVQLQRHHVLRAEADVDVTYKRLKGFVEVGLQDGEDMIVLQDAIITSNSYIWTGLEYGVGPLSVRYHFNAIAYNDAQQTEEYLHQPGLAFAAGAYCTFVAEMAFWQTSRPFSDRGERTLYLFASGAF